MTDIAGSPVEDVEDFYARLRGYPARSSFVLDVFRSGRELSLTLTPEKFPASAVDALLWERLGLKVSMAKGGLVVVGVRRGSQAAQFGLEPGDLVIKLNSEPVSSLEAFRDGVMSRQGLGLWLSVRRGAFPYYLGFRF